jgi:hypothetical protein
VIGWFSRRLSRRGERGTVAASVAILAVPLLLLFGLVVDGGRALEAKLRAKDAAAEAARAGANNCDPTVLRGANPDGGPPLPGGGRCLITVFMQPQACDDALDSIRANAPEGASMTQCRIDDGGQVVTVGVQFQINTTFLGIAIKNLTVRSVQSARVYTGQ